MRERKLLFCIARQSGDPSDLALYHRQRNRCISLLCESKQKFFDNLASADSKYFWKSVKALNCKRNITSVTLSDGMVTADTSFEKRWSLITSFLDALIASTLLCVPLPFLFFTFLTILIQQTFLPISYAPLILLLNRLLSYVDASKSSGPDGIASKMLKMTAPSIAPSLTKFFNLSLTTSMLPTDWKLAPVVPIPRAKP